MKNIRKMLYFTLAVLLFAAGIIGLMLPVIPQVPFFIAGVIFMMHASTKFKSLIKKSRLYREHAEKIISKNKFLSKIQESIT